MGLAGAVVGAAVVGGVATNVAANKAASATDKATRGSIAATQQAAQQARGDINKISPEAQQSANLGFQGALDTFGQSVPAQLQAFQEGNVGAQQAILSGLPQMQNAILGGNVDLSGLQAFQQQLPEAGRFQAQIAEFDQAAALQGIQDSQAMANTIGPFTNQVPTGEQFADANQWGNLSGVNQWGSGAGIPLKIP